MSKKLNRVGQKFGRLTVIEDSGRRKNGCVAWECKCDCGNLVEVSSSHLQSGNTRSCGCIQREKSALRMDTMNLLLKGKKHPSLTQGDTTDGQLPRIYITWKSMKQRTSNPDSKDYEYYGGRGIVVCDEWINDYVVFRDWAYDNGYNDTLCIDRIESDDGYYPGNVQFITKSENSQKTQREKREKHRINQ